MAVDVDVTVTGIQEVKLVELVRQRLPLSSLEEVRQIRELVELAEQEFELVDAKPGSVRLVFCCTSRPALLCLLDWIDTGRLHSAVNKLFQLLLPEGVTVSIRRLLLQKDAAQIISMFPQQKPADKPQQIYTRSAVLSNTSVCS